MKKAILISFKLKELCNILNGQSQSIIRKSLPKDYVGWVYCYCGNGKEWLWHSTYTNDIGVSKNKKYADENYNGLIPCRFWCEEVDIVLNGGNRFYVKDKDEAYTNELARESKRTFGELKDYSKGKDLYAIRITNLEIFDKPKELSDFENYMPKINDIPECCISSSWEILHQPLSNPPKNYQYVWAKELTCNRDRLERTEEEKEEVNNE